MVLIGFHLSINFFILLGLSIYIHLSIHLLTYLLDVFWQQHPTQLYYI